MIKPMNFCFLIQSTFICSFRISLKVIESFCFLYSQSTLQKMVSQYIRNQNITNFICTFVLPYTFVEYFFCTTSFQDLAGFDIIKLFILHTPPIPPPSRHCLIKIFQIYLNLRFNFLTPYFMNLKKVHFFKDSLINEALRLLSQICGAHRSMYH